MPVTYHLNNVIYYKSYEKVCWECIQMNDAKKVS